MSRYKSSSHNNKNSKKALLDNKHLLPYWPNAICWLCMTDVDANVSLVIEIYCFNLPLGVKCLEVGVTISCHLVAVICHPEALRWEARVWQKGRQVKRQGRSGGISEEIQWVFLIWHFKWQERFVHAMGSELGREGRIIGRVIERW